MAAMAHYQAVVQQAAQAAQVHLELTLPAQVVLAQQILIRLTMVVVVKPEVQLFRVAQNYMAEPMFLYLGQ